MIELEPASGEIVWQYPEAPSDAFFSKWRGGAQRLPNGNTLICNGAYGTIFEVATDGTTVWEYISPYWGKYFKMNMVYRAYRVPYGWVPQIDPPMETTIAPIDVTTFRVPGAAPGGTEAEVRVEGTIPYQSSSALCVTSDTDEEI